MRKYLLLLIMIVSLPLIINADVFPKSGTASLQYLKFGVDARAIGMGGAYVSVSDDISGTYWNPAAVCLAGKNQVFFSHNQYVADIMHDFAAASFQTGFGDLALSISALHMPSMDVTTVENFGPNGEVFYASNFAVGLTYSRKYTDKFSFGMTGKYINENLEEESIHSYAFDLGTIYNTGWKNMKIGMALRNYGPDIQYEIDQDDDGTADEEILDDIDNDGDGLIDEDLEEYSFKIPMSYSLGVSADLFSTDMQKLIASIDVVAAVDTKEASKAGLEYTIGTFAVRTGYLFYDENAETYSFGLGWKIPTSFAIFDVDYSYTDMGYLSETAFKTPHRISLKMAF